MDELRSLHAQMSEVLADLDRLTQEATCDGRAVMAARYRLTRLSGARRQRVIALCDARLASGDASPSIIALRDHTLQAAADSSRHIGSWELRRVASEWAGYRRASAAMRARLRRDIAREAEILEAMG